MRIIQGDCLEKMAELEDNSVDTIITDPPYGLSFMGKKWDYDVPSIEIWKECLRVLKPGGTALIFAGSRTQHRMAVNVEDAGFELKDCIMWLYSTGFPKATDISKQLDKGVERKVVGKMSEIHPRYKTPRKGAEGYGNIISSKEDPDITEPATPEAKLWNGWKSHGLKPAYEPILVAVKPNDGTYANNALKWGVSGLNIDGGRIETEEEIGRDNTGIKGSILEPKDGWNNNSMVGLDTRGKQSGRFPANILLDEEAAKMLDEQSGVSKSSTGKRQKRDVNETDTCGNWGMKARPDVISGHNDKGGASRFFYVAKSSKSERNKGLDCYLTVKYNDGINSKETLCKEENMVVAQLLQRVISGSMVNFSTGESGENIMGRCHRDSLSIILTETKKIIELKTLNLLMHSLTNESTLDVNSEKEAGGSLAENVESLKKWLLTTTKENQELALGVSSVALQMLLKISEKENWKEATNFHSTVKPLKLMEYLCTLTKTPTGGIVLDPFAGSGTTGVACQNTGRDYILIEREEEYIPIIKARLNQKQRKLL